MLSIAPWALAALLTLSRARQRARSAVRFVPVDDQDVGLWDAGLVREGEEYLRRAAEERARRGVAAAGRFELEAAIQSVHCARARTGVLDLGALETLYRALLLVAPTLGGRVALASAVAERHGAAAGLRMLEAIDDSRVSSFQPAWALRAALLDRQGDGEGAGAAYERAASLASDAETRDWLLKRR